MRYFLFVFPNTHSAISAQKHLENKVNFSVMPTLREISNSCGISVRVQEENWQDAKALIENSAEVESFRLYSVVSENGKAIPTEVEI